MKLGKTMYIGNLKIREHQNVSIDFWMTSNETIHSKVSENRNL